MSLKLEVLTPTRAAFEGAADAVVLPAVDGECGVLPGHAPYLTLLGEGVLTYRDGARTGALRIRGGFALVSGDAVRVLAESAEPSEPLVEKSSGVKT